MDSGVMKVVSSLLTRFVLIAVLVTALALPAAAQRRLPPVVPAVPPAESAPVAMLVDVSNGQVLHARNPQRRFVPASVTKVMTLYLAFELMEEGRLDPDQAMVMSPAIFRDWRRKGSNMFLNLGDQVLVRDLLMGIANVSANDGAAVLAEGFAGSVPAWTGAMNAKASEIGMTGSYFASPNGWPDQGQTFTTAQDLIVLGRTMIARHPTLFRQFVGHPGFFYNGIAQVNHDPLTGRFPGADGIKTGFTNEAGFNYLGTAKRGDQRLIMVLAGVPDGRTRAQLAQNYMEWGFTAFERRALYAQGMVIGHARVQNGAARQVALVAEGAVAINLPQGHSAPLAASIEYDGPLKAPVMAGQEVAVLTITAPGMAPARIPLVARNDVAVASPFDRVVNGLAGWLAW
jgi:serine-type D-Ala-D-Ala carboxypeptidase (penicillin-binding protein 5/6)